jgi:hypothetical protein
MVTVFGFQVSGVRFKVSGMRCQVSGVRIKKRKIWNLSAEIVITKCMLKLDNMQDALVTNNLAER